MTHTKRFGLPAAVTATVLATALAAVFMVLFSVSAAALQSSEGQVGVQAYTRMNAETTASADHLQESKFHNETDYDTDANGVANSSYNYPPPPPNPYIGFTCPDDGCADFEGRAYGHADARGTLKAYASAHMYIGNTPTAAGYIFSDGHAAIDDTITLSHPATVVLRGKVEGEQGGYNSDPDLESDPNASLEANLRFSRERGPGDPDPGPDGGPWVDLGGFSEEYQVQAYSCDVSSPNVCGALPGATNPDPVDDPFSVTVDLPAGTSNFNAVMNASIDFQVYGRGDRIISKSALLDFANTLDFEIEVPERVVATSGSGLLPIVGGATPNTAPVGNDQSATTNEETPKTITLTGSDADDNDLTFEITGAPSNGTLGSIGPVTCTGTAPKTCSADVTYTPTANFDGTDSFTYRSSDGISNSNTATVTITVSPVDEPSPSPPPSGAANTAPQITANIPTKTRDKTPILTATITDQESELSSSNISVSVDGEPVTGFSYDASSGKLSFTSKKLKKGSHTLRIEATDGELNSSESFYFKVKAKKKK